jgi:plasmid replication initiation protein
VAQLREIFAVGKKFPDYNNFKRYTFAHAVDEINAQYEMNLKFEEIKEGRKVVSIRFEFTKSYTVQQGYNPATKQMVNITVKPKRKPKQENSKKPEQQELPIETKKRPNKSAEEIKSIIEALIKEEKLTETEATILAIKLKLI